MFVIDILKKTKHEVFFFKKNTRKRIDKLNTYIIKNKPYIYDKDDHLFDLMGRTLYPLDSTMINDHTLIPHSFKPADILDDAPKQLFICWTGENEIPVKRKKILDSIIEDNRDIQVNFITSSNLSEWEVKDWPIHPAYKNLTYTQRSDYLRAYFMHNYGGAYTDLKKCSVPWSYIINQVNSSPVYWAAGPHEVSSRHVSAILTKIGIKRKIYFSRVLNQFAFAFKPHSLWTYELLTETERRMSYFEKVLEEFPANSATKSYPEYPIPWDFLQSQISAPLSLKYNEHFKVLPEVTFDFDYLP